MYLKKVKIDNIRSIKDFEISFDKPAGWHVLIGDNGSGKTTILRAIAVGMIGHEEVLRLDPDWDSWLKKGEKEADIYLETKINIVDSLSLPQEAFNSDKDPFKGFVDAKMEGPIEKTEKRHLKIISEEKERKLITVNDAAYIGFGVGFGPFRRFLGGSQVLERLHSTSKSVGNYVSLFKEDAALFGCTVWIKNIHYKSLEGNSNAKKTLSGISKIIEVDNFLPNNYKIEKIGSDGIFFRGNDNVSICIDELSEGVKSVLSMTFELIKILHLSFSADEIFEFIESENPYIPCEGVVLIDEIDAHLHPTWQTKIGEWFTKIFPKIQFIVTTHSPLICRAAANGSIWRLPTLGTDEKVREIIGTEKDRLVYGNVLDAYGTEAFGREAVRSQQSNEKLQRLGELNMLSALGKISNKEEKERLELQTILSTDAPTGF